MLRHAGRKRWMLSPQLRPDSPTHGALSMIVALQASMCTTWASWADGALAGLVAITSGTSTIEPWGAIIVGFVAGALYILGSKCSVWFKVRLLLACSQCILPAAWLHPCKLLQCLRIQSSESRSLLSLMPGKAHAVCCVWANVLVCEAGCAHQ